VRPSSVEMSQAMADARGVGGDCSVFWEGLCSVLREAVAVSQSSCDRAQMSTPAAWCASNDRAVAYPMPFVPPVTTKFLDSRFHVFIT